MFRYPGVLLIALLALAISAPASQAQDVSSHARIVRMSYVAGNVQLNGAPANMNSPITEGAVLITGSDGLAEVQFEDSSAIRVASETQITFAQLARLSSGDAITRVDLDDGEAEFLVPSSSVGLFAVNVRDKNILFRQPGRFRILSTHASPLEIAVWKGEAVVSDRESGHDLAVKMNETFTLNPDDPGQYDLQSEVLADDLDQWSTERDQTLRAALSTTYVSPDNGSAYSSGNGGYSPTYLLGFNGYGSNGYGCPYGFGGINYWQPFWLGAGNCWNSGFGFQPFGFQPFFFQPPVFVVVQPPVHPRHPPIVHPPTPPVVAKGAPVSTPVKPQMRNPRIGGGGSPRVFTDDNIRRSVPRAEGSGETSQTVENGQAVQEPVNEVRPVGVAPGQRSAGNGPASQPAHAAPASSTAPPSHPSHSSPPSAPSRSYSPPPSSSAGSRGFSGASASHSSPPPSHSGSSGSGKH